MKTLKNTLINLRESDKENGIKELPPEAEALKTLINLLEHKKAMMKALSEDVKDLFREYAKNYNTKISIIKSVVSYKLNNVSLAEIDEETFEIKTLLEKVQ